MLGKMMIVVAVVVIIIISQEVISFSTCYNSLVP
jgi:hypothetical protein